MKFRSKYHCKIAAKSILNKSTLLEGNNVLGKGHFESAKIGFGSYVGSAILSGCKVGRFTSIGHNFNYVGVTHKMGLVSTYPGFYNTISRCGFKSGNEVIYDEYLKTDNGYFLEIGNDVWIGNNVTCKAGIKIGDGSIIGFNSVVTKDVPPFAIVAGNPAKIIRYRFDQETIEKLLEIKWWNDDISKIRNSKELFLNINEFLKSYHQ